MLLAETPSLNCRSEDWAFSHMLHRLGLKVMATKAVPCGHWGMKEFRKLDELLREVDTGLGGHSGDAERARVFWGIPAIPSGKKLSCFGDG
jgi:hypothetical protein